MTDRKPKRSKAGAVELTEEQLDQASGGVAIFSELAGISSSVDVVDDASAPRQQPGSLKKS